MAHDGIREFVQPVSRAAKEAHLRSVQTESRVGAMGFAGSGDAPALFRENELLIGAEHVDAIDKLTGIFGGRAIRPRPFPPRPSELGPPARDLRQVEPPPDSVRVVFSEPPRVRDAAAIFDRAASRSTDSSPPHFSSEMAASVAALVASIDVPRESVGLNHLVEPAGLNMLFTTEAPVTEWGQSDPQLWPAFSGPARIVEAWQLVDSYRAGNGGTALTTLAVMDRGFWFDAAGQPLRHPGQTGSDLDRGVFTYNIDKDNRDISESSSNRDWHGNGAASLAAATVNNQQGAAGAGGTVAFPVLMKHGGDIFSVMRGIKVCGLWGIDVVSMSFGVGPQTIWDYFPDSDWVNAFQYAVDRDVVIVVAAGNSAYRLPDEWVRPATRTPGVITVGALAADNVTARGDSNYGPSVTLWAPGTLLPVMPDADHRIGTRMSGTSAAAPLVAGTAAMLRAVDPSISNAGVEPLLQRTGWVGEPGWLGTGKVTRGLDAFAAVNEVLQGVLPDPGDAGDSLATARPLQTDIMGGVRIPRPDGLAISKQNGDADYWSFSTTDYSELRIQVVWYHKIANLYVEVLDASGREIEGLTTDYPADGVFFAAGNVPQGGYIVKVKSYGGVTAYSLGAGPWLTPLQPDRFEPNNSFDSATQLRFHKPPLDVGQGHGPGTFNLTLHRYKSLAATFPYANRWKIDTDFFRFWAPAHDGKRIPFIFMHSDKPVTVTLFDEHRNVIRQWGPATYHDVRPPEQATSFLKVSGDEQTRYSLTLAMMADPRFRPADFPEYEVMPEWWLDPDAIEFVNPEVRYAVELTSQPAELGVAVGESIAIANTSLEDLPVTVELLDLSGNVIAKGEHMAGRVEINTRGVEPGLYALRLTRPEDTAVTGLRFVAPSR